MGARVENQIKPLGGMSLNAVREYLVLLPTGQAFRGLPLGGHVFDMNFTAECVRLPGRLQEHIASMAGESILFGAASTAWPPPAEFDLSNKPAATQSNIANLSGTRAFEVTLVHNFHIAGRFTGTFFQSGTIGIRTNVTAQTFIAFQPDGRYETAGFSAASFSGRGASGSVQSNRSVETGRYTVDGYALTLISPRPARSARNLHDRASKSPSPRRRQYSSTTKHFYAIAADGGIADENSTNSPPCFPWISLDAPYWLETSTCLPVGLSRRTGRILYTLLPRLQPGKTFTLTIEPPASLGGQDLSAWLVAHIQSDMSRRGVTAKPITPRPTRKRNAWRRGDLSRQPRQKLDRHVYRRSSFRRASAVRLHAIWYIAGSSALPYFRTVSTIFRQGRPRLAVIHPRPLRKAFPARPFLCFVVLALGLVPAIAVPGDDWDGQPLRLVFLSLRPEWPRVQRFSIERYAGSL